METGLYAAFAMNICSSDHDTCIRYHIHCVACGIQVSTAAMDENGKTYCGHCISLHILREMGLELRRYWLETVLQKNAIYRFYTASDEFSRD